MRKPDITAGQMAASAGINTFFTVNCLVDLSVAHFAVSHDQIAFLQQFLRWREQEGVISGVMFIALFGLPVALMTMAFGVWGALRGHKASRLRHFADIGQFFTLCCVLLPMVVTQVLPSAASMAKCSDASSATCRDMAEKLRFLFGTLLILNVAMLVWDIAKFLGNNEHKRQDKVAPKLVLSPRGDGDSRRTEKSQGAFSPASGADARGKWA